MGGEGGGNKLVLELEEIPGHPPPQLKTTLVCVDTPVFVVGWLRWLLPGYT